MPILICSHCQQKLHINKELPSDRPFRFTCPKCGLVTTQVPQKPVSEKIVISFDQPEQPPQYVAPVVSQVQASAELGPLPPIPKLSPRQRRLMSDEKETLEFFRDFPLIDILSRRGTPADTYIVEYRIRGIERLEHNQPVYRNIHQVEIQLGSGYPRTPPTCRMLTPIFHPNIEPAVICIGDHWSAQERLCYLIVRIGEIICFQSYNIHSPLDGLAAQWADLNQNLLPTDSRFLMP